MQPIYLNTYKIYIQNAKVMKKNESDKKKRDYFAVSLALAKKTRLLSPCPHVPMSPYPSNLYLVPAHFGRELWAKGGLLV